MKKIIIFEDLDKKNFYFSILLIPFFKKIYFREASYGKTNTYFTKKLNKIFFQIGLKNYSGKLFQRSFNIKKYLLRKFIKNNFKIEIFNEFCKLINLEIKDIKKLIFTLENKIYINKLEAIEAGSYICIKKEFSNNQTYYVPSTDKSYLIMKQIKNNNLKIISSLLYLSIFFSGIKSLLKIIFNKKITSSRETIISNKKNINETNCKIGYFPHQGLKYGNFFKKTFFFSKHSRCNAIQR
jgi:hypothetical protein